VLAAQRLQKNFGNAGAVDNLIGQAQERQQRRLRAAGKSGSECAADQDTRGLFAAWPETAAEAARRRDPEAAILFGDLIGCEDVLQLRAIQRTLKREQHKQRPAALALLCWKQ
jgi:hypothetical protein